MKKSSKRNSSATNVDNESRAAPNPYEGESLVPDILNECASIYTKSKGNPVSAVHLTALSTLCAYGNEQGLECSWIYDAFRNEVKSKYETNLKMFYLGAFAQAMKLQGCSLNQTKQALRRWTGLSTRHTEKSHALYIKNAVFNLGSPKLILLENQILEFASAVINSISEPFPEGIALKFFRKLEIAIAATQYGNASLPFEGGILVRKRK